MHKDAPCFTIDNLNYDFYLPNFIKSYYEIYKDYGLIKFKIPNNSINLTDPDNYYSDKFQKTVISSVLSQKITKADGKRFQKDCDVFFISNRSVSFKKTVSEYRMVQEEEHNDLKNIDLYVEEYIKYLNDNHRQSAMYGADIEGTFFRTDSKFHLSTIDKCLFRNKIPGITLPYLYFGSKNSSFAWHTEDHNLFSVNYHHFGKPKIWFAVGSHIAKAIEDMVIGKLAPEDQKCTNFMSHKNIILNPDIVEQNLKNISDDFFMTRTIQRPGEIVITFPAAYHGGFNTGFNCNEAINFANEIWLRDFHESFNQCNCGHFQCPIIDKRIFRYLYSSSDANQNVEGNLKIDPEFKRKNPKDKYDKCVLCLKRLPKTVKISFSKHLQAKAAAINAQLKCDGNYVCPKCRMSVERKFEEIERTQKRKI